jgi:hypothetical protein
MTIAYSFGAIERAEPGVATQTNKLHGASPKNSEKGIDFVHLIVHII